MDLKDKKILYELSKNSRLSSRQIAKRVSLSRDAVIYRIKNLEKKGAIQKYIAVVNLKKLNYRTHIIFLEFKKFDLETEKSILAYLVNFPYTIWVASPSGNWDVIIDIVSKDTDQFDRNLTTIINHLGNNLKNYEVLETIKEFYYNHKYLTGQTAKEEREKLIEYAIDETDYLILKEISQNSRINSTEIAEKLKISHDQVSYKIRKLLQSSYIDQFTVMIDFSKLDLSYYYLFLQFNKLDKQTEIKIINFLKSQKEVLFLGKNAGKFNFNVDVIVENPIKLKEFITKLRVSFGDILESKETILMFEQIKNNYFPEGVFKDLLIQPK